MMALTAISDYALTLWGGRLYRGAMAHLAIEGSYETVPIFQADIDAGRIISLRFIIVLIAMAGLLGLVAKFRAPLGIDDPIYLALAGFLILIEVPIHVRHVSNIVRFRLLANAGAADGRVSFARWYILRVSSVDFFSFSALFFLAYASTESWFTFGGAIRCFAFGVFQLLLSLRAARRRVPAVA